jgi:probable rRNA maturation factor
MIARVRRANGPAVEIVVMSSRWKKVAAAQRLIQQAIAAAAPASARKNEVTVVLTDDAAIRKLNRKWRRRDKATNVLSFPAPLSRQPTPRFLGDIVIAYSTVAAEAKAQRKPFDHHLVHLAVHGFLHLLGYDHESDHAAERMERRERKILVRLAIPNPYALSR